MPAYNEAGNIKEAVDDLINHVMNVVPECECIIVNDGSKDDTGKILDELASHEPRLKIVHQQNAGHGVALMTGLAHCQGDYILLLDSDRQIPVSAFALLWDLRDDNDAVIGYRVSRQDPAIRLLLSALIRFTLRVMSAGTLQDANVPFKLLKREAYLNIRPLLPLTCTAPSLFLSVVLSRRAAKVLECPVYHRPRTQGASINGWKLMKTCWKGLMELVTLRKQL